MNTQTPHPLFDSNQAWQEAQSLIKGNRDLLLALAGVFIILPAFAIAVLFPLPEPVKGADLNVYMAALGEYYRKNGLLLVVSGLIHTAGTLAMTVLFTDATRPTVGQAIRQGFARMPTVIIAQFTMGAGIGVMLIVPMLLGKMTGNQGLTVLGAIAAIGLGVWALTRFALIPVVVVAERCGNPLRALGRAWQLTAGHTLRLLMFFALLLIVAVVLSFLASGIVNAVLALAIGGEAAFLGSTLMGICVQAAMTVCFYVVFAASYRQLAGASAAETLISK